MRWSKLAVLAVMVIAALRSWILQPHPVLAPMPRAEPRITGARAAGATVTCRLSGWAGPTAVQSAVPVGTRRGFLARVCLQL
jgi:hypothetical protein